VQAHDRRRARRLFSQVRDAAQVWRDACLSGQSALNRKVEAENGAKQECDPGPDLEL
jgi:hypothetical protein